MYPININSGITMTKIPPWPGLSVLLEPCKWGTEDPRRKWLRQLLVHPQNHQTGWGKTWKITTEPIMTWKIWCQVHNYMNILVSNTHTLFIFEASTVQWGQEESERSAWWARCRHHSLLHSRAQSLKLKGKGLLCFQFPTRIFSDPLLSHEITMKNITQSLFSHFVLLN